MLIDSHCHLDYYTEAERPHVLTRAVAAGVGEMVTIGTTLSQSQCLPTMAVAHPNLWCTVGIHPHHAAEAPVPAPEAIAALTDHPKVIELRALSEWSEGQVWSSPEHHGAITGVLKNQIDWIPLNIGAVRPTQGRTLAVMQVSGGSQSFNAVNTLRLLGRWMRMFTIPNQSSVAKAYEQFDEAGRMKDSSYRDRVVDVMEELFKFTLLTRDISPYLVDRYSERKESAEELSKRVDQRTI